MNLLTTVTAPYRRTRYGALLQPGKPTLREVIDFENARSEVTLTPEGLISSTPKTDAMAPRVPLSALTLPGYTHGEHGDATRCATCHAYVAQCEGLASDAMF